MNCPQCQQSTDPGAAFCGNCGFQLAATAQQPEQNFQASPLGQPAVAGMPAYALATPAQQAGDTKALLALILGVIAIPAGIFIPIIGLLFGIIGLVLGTMSRRSHKKTLSLLGIIFSTIAVLGALASWAYAFEHLKKTETSRNQPSGSSSNAIASSSINTPCYSLAFVQRMNTDHDQKDSCDVRAYEGATILASNDVYKVYGNEIANLTEANFDNVAKAAIEKDVSTTLPGFAITSEGPARFAGSPAYIVNAVNQKENITVVEAAVFHSVSAGYNVFSLVHATKGESTDLKTAEAQWQWK